MKVCFLAAAIPGEDPSEPLRRSAEGLAARGHEVTIAITEERPPAPVPLAGGATALAAEDAIAEGADVAIAWSWEATTRLFEIPAVRHAFRVDGFGHERLPQWRVERIAALLAYDLPVDFIAAAPWVAQALGRRRPDARSVAACAGLDHERFGGERTAAPAGAPLRVLLDPRGDGGAAAAAATAPLKVAELDPGRRAEQYRDADVLLMLDPVDGVLGTPLEAARAGVVPIVLPAGGQEDLVEHGVSGVVATPEDPRGTGRWLDRLAGDRELLARLSTATRERATGWPSWEQAAGDLEAALRGLLAHEPPPQAQWPARLMADAMAGVIAYRSEVHLLNARIKQLEEDPAVQAALRARASAPGRALRVVSRGLRGRNGDPGA